MEDHAQQFRRQSSRLSPIAAPSASASSPGQPQRRFEAESWVEVSSQPSSSSLSSIGDEIVTTGLRVGGPYNRRRRLQSSNRSLAHQQTAIYATGTSSQEEYDESESDEDHVLTSSTENVLPTQDAVQDSDGDSDDGDNATALGRANDRPVFRPQPNAFSHPPSHLRSYSSNSAIPSHPHGGFRRPSFAQRSQTTRMQRGAPNFMSPSAREDNDAALRASLTTLLSCAAAARGLPKTKDEFEAQRATNNNGVGPSTQPVELRLVPESELSAEPPQKQATSTTPPSRRRSPVRKDSKAGAAREQPKRPVSAGRSPRATKKKRVVGAAEESLISPTLLTWVVSAGVVVLVSVVGFGAGYVIGREVGRQETLAASVGSMNDTSSCGREVIRSSGGGLRRLRWAAVGRSIVSQG